MECYPYALLKSATSLELHLGLTKNLFTVKVNFRNDLIKNKYSY